MSFGRPRGRPSFASKLLMTQEEPDLLTCSARHEAEQLFAMVRIGSETVEGVRTLVDVPPRLCLVLRQAARAGVTTHTIDAALAFRLEVRQYFDAIVAARVGKESHQ